MGWPEKAKKIIRKAEKHLLQARIKAINIILDNVAKQTELCRSQLASIISAQRLRECQGFIDKVGDIRFTKVKQRQLNKFNILINKKEGNITRSNSTNSTNLASQAGRQALLPPGEGSNLVAQTTQSGSQASTLLSPRGRKQPSSSKHPGRQSGRCSPSSQGRKQLSSSNHSVRQLPPRPIIYPRQAVRQALSFPQGKEAIYPRQAVKQVFSFPLGEGSTST